MRNPSLSSSSNKKTPCCIKVGLKRGPWTPEEDELLSNYINQEGEGRWRTLPKRAGLLRCGKSCRLRWMNYLRPSVKRGHIMPDEEDLILRLHRLLGNRWSLIAGRIPGRTDNEIKNYWNTHLSKKLISQGIDPRTHKPLNPNPNSHAPLAPPNPNPNPNPSSSILEDKGGYGGANAVDDNHSNQYLPGTNLDRNGSIVGADHAINDSWHNYDPLLMGHGNSNEDDDINDCTDDIFSSFLNSLMNEDMFPPQQHQMHNVIGPSDPQVSFIREAASLSPAGMNNKDEHGWLADAVDKHF